MPPEFLHPGVYVEERRRGVAPIQGVSTSNYGVAGFSLKGPTDEATLVTSFDAFEREFGTFTEKGQMPTHVFAFFANGGQRAYVVRVVASDAVVADGFVTNDVTDDVMAQGDGSNKDFTSGGAGPLTPVHVPLEPGSLSVTYRTGGTPVAGQVVTPNVAPDGAQLDFSFIIQTGGEPIAPGTVTIGTTITGPAAVTYDDNASAPVGNVGLGILYDTGNNIRGYVNYETGQVTLSVETGNEPDVATTITADYTPADVLVTLTDDGAGALNGTTLAAPGTVDYATGDMEFTVDAGADAPLNRLPIAATYRQRVWDIDPSSAGEWGNSITVQTRGNVDAFTRATASYSRHDVLVALDGVVEDGEIFLDLSFTDPTDARYVGTIINNGSNLISFVEPSNEDTVPEQLDGLARTQSVGGGDGAQLDFGSTDGTGGTPTIPVAFRAAALGDLPIQPGSVSITYTDTTGTTRTITDDGNGNLVGDVDGAAPVGLNTVDYTTGAFAFRCEAGQAPAAAESSHLAVPTNPQAASIITAAYRSTPAETLSEDALTGGSDGVAPIGRDQLTNPTLKASRRGMYALLTTDELMNVALPDTAGDVTMAVDQVTEAETNGKWFIILAPPPSLTPQEVRDYRRNDLGITSSYGALYYPYITISDPVTSQPLNVPPAGHIAGVYARTDTTRNVGKAPAGTADGLLSFSIGLERNLEFAEIDVFFQSQVNALMDTPQTGRVVWGARTLESPPGDFQYIQVRRLFNFLKTSIFNSTHGFVFESIGSALRSRITLSVESFMRNLFNQGLFAGTTPSEAYTVICDDSNNPKEVEDAGQVICDIFVAPNKPGEFIRFRIQQKFETT